MSPATSRAFDPLRFRPLLWMALAALCGVAAGGQWARMVRPDSRSDLNLVLPLIPALLCAVGAVLLWRNALWRRICVAALLFFLFASGAARRLTPPAGDISELVKLEKVPDGAVQPVPVKISGVVADYPRIGDFNVQFPLECSSPRRGRVWISAPFDQKFRIGDRVELLAELQALPWPGNTGERDSSWRFIGASCWCLGRKVVVASRLGIADGYATARRIGMWREGLLRHYETQFRGGGNDASLRLRPFPAASAQVLTAMVFGEGGLSRPLPQILRDDFRASGLSHVLVSSGSQVGFLVVIGLFLLRGLGFKRSPLLLLIVPVLVFYALLAGGAASIWRATLGGFLACCALLTGRDVDGLSVWGAAMLLLLCLDPAVAWSLSFQLTFAATWGMMVVSPALANALTARFGDSYILKLASLSLGAQSATLPLSLLHFGTFSMAGLGANFVAVPLASAMIVSGLIGLIFTPVNLINYYLARGAASLAHVSAALPGAYYEGSPIRLTSAWWCYALLLLAIAPFSFDASELRDTWARRFNKLKSKLSPPVVGGFFLLVALWLWWLQNGPNNPNLRVTMLDVGQGEAILIRSPSGQNVLIDGGSLENQPRSDIGAQVLVPALQSLGVERLDLVVLTHADADHCNGLKEVAQEIPIGAFLDGPGAVQQAPDPAQVDYWELRKVLEAQKVPFIKPRQNDVFPLGEARLQLLGPEMPPLQAENDNCIVSRLDFGNSSFLFTGDIEKEAEERLLQRGANLRCTVLKVAHHGSKGSSSAGFLQAASPKVALISSGRFNSFGHPGAETLHRLNVRGAAIFRTDVSGAIEVDCDRDACRVLPFKG
jgi:competence protein ComEC